MAQDRVIAWNNTEGWKDWTVSDYMAWHRGLVKQFGNRKTPDGKYYLTDAYFVTFWLGSEATGDITTMQKKLRDYTCSSFSVQRRIGVL